jgi:hypothetical protein
MTDLKLKTGITRLILGLLILSNCACYSQVPSKKINGISLVASREKTTQEHIEPLKEINANAIAVMPFGFLKDLESPELKFNDPKQWYGERLEGAREAIQLLHKNNFEVMLKPQVWVWKGEFTGDIKMKSEEDWKKLEQNYRDFILLYAGLAAEEKVEIYCVGTELYQFINSRETFWRELIAEVRTIYKGKLTYAENWDKIEKTDIWEELDFIGVDAYFPIHEDRAPTVDQLKSGWDPHKKLLNNLSDSYGKKVLFTEYGYRNTDYAAKEPWDSSRQDKVLNNELQVNALDALYQQFWMENWFAGGFLWKWHQEHQQSGGSKDDQFTPQNKPAEQLVKDVYSGKFRE